MPVCRNLKYRPQGEMVSFEQGFQTARVKMQVRRRALTLVDDRSRTGNVSDLPPPSQAFSNRRNVVESSERQPHCAAQASDFGQCRIQRFYAPLLLALLALISRLYRISDPNFVIWDEFHFGKFASRYLTREFFWDLHPPHGKMLLALAGRLFGLNGTFVFNLGAVYPSASETGAYLEWYIGMRIFCALFGAAVVPIAYFTGYELGLSFECCLLFAIVVLFDGALVQISKLILLDSMLLFFTALSLFCLVVFRNQQLQAPFSSQWFFWLFATGASLGCVVSIKWVGLFAVAGVGLYTIQDLWNIWSDLNMHLLTYAKHWISRIVALIFLPSVIYIAGFYIHFLILTHTGTEEANSFMSPLFQAGLAGNSLNSNPAVVAFGSTVSLRNQFADGRLLSAQPQVPADAQVIAVRDAGAASRWILRKHGGTEDGTGGPVFLRDADLVSLVHNETRATLYPSAYRAPRTVDDNRVECQPTLMGEDVETAWKLEFVDDLVSQSPSVLLNALTTRFRLRNQKTQCLLRQTGQNLMDTSGTQAEVSCQLSKEKGTEDLSTLWTVEGHWNSKLLPSSPTHHRAHRFWSNFLETHARMLQSNDRLAPNPDKNPDSITSRPWQWPLVSVGMRMGEWTNSGMKLFLLGNVMSWVTGAIAIGVSALILVAYKLRRNRGIDDWQSAYDWNQFVFASQIGLFGWLLHFLPFCVMSRVTYLHHYFPAVYFAFLQLAVVFHHLKNKLPPRLHCIFVFCFGCAVFVVFLYFKDFCYGFDVPAAEYKGRRLRPGWGIYDS